MGRVISASQSGSSALTGLASEGPGKREKQQTDVKSKHICMGNAETHLSTRWHINVSTSSFPVVAFGSENRGGPGSPNTNKRQDPCRTCAFLLRRGLKTLNSFWCSCYLGLFLFFLTFFFCKNYLSYFSIISKEPQFKKTVIWIYIYLNIDFLRWTIIINQYTKREKIGEYHKDLRNKSFVDSLLFLSFYMMDTLWVTSIRYQRIKISTFWRYVCQSRNAELGLSVILQRLSIKEMQNSIDFVAAKVPRLRSMTILTPFPEQNVTKFTQQWQMVSDAICEDQREVDFQVVLILLLKILQFLWENSTNTFDQQLLCSLG